MNGFRVCMRTGAVTLPDGRVVPVSLDSPGGVVLAALRVIQTYQRSHRGTRRSRGGRPSKKQSNS